MKSNDSVGNLNDLPNLNYVKFFEKFKEIESIAIKEWGPTHLIGYFCKKYKEHYSVDYKFKFNTPQPSKCFEVFQIKKLAQLLSSDPEILVKYIDWIFITKVKQAKRKLTSISFMTHEGVVNDYKLKYLLVGKDPLSKPRLSRTASIPIEFMDIIRKYSDQITTYGDLSFILQMGSSITEDYKNMIDELQNNGFNIKILEKIV